MPINILSGASSEVYLAKDKEGSMFAVKVIPWRKVIQNKSLASEIKILKKLTHPRVIRLVDVFVDELALKLVLEL